MGELKATDRHASQTPTHRRTPAPHSQNAVQGDELGRVRGWTSPARQLDDVDYAGGQDGLHGPHAPVRHPAKRPRIRTVMQELIYRAGRLIETGRRIILGLGRNDRAANAFDATTPV